MHTRTQTKTKQRAFSRCGSVEKLTVTLKKTLVKKSESIYGAFLFRNDKSKYLSISVSFNVG